MSPDDRIVGRSVLAVAFACVLSVAFVSHLLFFARSDTDPRSAV